MNNETYHNILNKAFDKMKPQFPEMVAVVNIPPKQPEIAVVSVASQPILIPAPTKRYFLILLILVRPERAKTEY